MCFENLQAIDHEDDPVLVLHALHVAAGREIADVEDIFAVRRESVLDQHAAARSQRQSFDVEALVGSVAR